MKIVLTGHQGFVGHHIGRTLIRAGHEVIGVDDYRSGVQLTKESDGYAQSVFENFRNYDPRGAGALVHVAAHADVSKNWDSPAERGLLWRNNVDATRELYENAYRVGVKRIVFISTLATTAPELSPYAASKLAGEALTRCYAQEAFIFRLAACVGEGYHHGHVADFARMAIRYGRVTAKSNGQPRRSYVHVLDVADAVAEAVAAPAIAPGKRCDFLRQLSGGEWSPQDTVRVMGCESTWASDDFGWKGDVAVTTPRNCPRSLELGVKEALASLGWR